MVQSFALQKNHMKIAKQHYFVEKEGPESSHKEEWPAGKGLKGSRNQLSPGWEEGGGRTSWYFRKGSSISKGSNVTAVPCLQATPRRAAAGAERGAQLEAAGTITRS